MVKKVQAYVPGYRLKQEVQFERYGDNNRLTIPGRGEFTGIKTSIFLEVEGAGDYLPSYSGNLDIMTAAAKATGELLARSEEHTSELQSLMRISYAVFCLKKKTTREQDECTPITIVYAVTPTTEEHIQE